MNWFCIFVLSAWAICLAGCADKSQQAIIQNPAPIPPPVPLVSGTTDKPIIIPADPTKDVLHDPNKPPTIETDPTKRPPTVGDPGLNSLQLQ